MKLDALAPLTSNIPTYPPEIDSLATKAIQQFASDNGFAFQLRNPDLVQYSWRDYKILPAWLGAVGIAATKDAYYILSGQYMGYPITMFLMWDNLTEGVYYRRPNEQQRLRYIQQQTAGIVRITLPKSFPQVVLDSNKNDRIQSSVRTEYEPSQRLILEGDFAKYFDLYVPTGIQINALSLLAPNMMQILMNHSGLFDVEFRDNELIIMTRKSLYSPETMDLLQEAMTEQLTYMNRLMQSWNYSPKNQPFDMLEKPNIGGSIIKLGRFRLNAKMQIIAISAFFVIFAIILVSFD
jgi:hypothetical protein